MDLYHLIALVKKKKELQGVADSFIKDCILSYMEKYSLQLDKFHHSDLKVLVKDIRAELRLLVGRFQLSSQENSLTEHLSTFERAENYAYLKKLLSSLNIKSILDLGCGLNPIALASPEIKYYAYDINEENLKKVSLYFRENNIDGETSVYDLRKADIALPKADITLILKVLDIIDKKGHKNAEALLRKIRSPHILVSFPTIKISGRRMQHPKRRWFELLSSRLGFLVSGHKSDNEIFYLLRSNKRSDTGGN